LVIPLTLLAEVLLVEVEPWACWADVVVRARLVAPKPAVATPTRRPGPRWDEPGGRVTRDASLQGGKPASTMPRK
jgi:hypothetical protein